MFETYVRLDRAAVLALFRNDPDDCPACRTPGGYCAVHGDYTPGSTDPEVLAAVQDNARRPRNGRVIRKPLEK